MGEVEVLSAPQAAKEGEAVPTAERTEGALALAYQEGLDEEQGEEEGEGGRRKRRSRARARTISIRRLSKTELNLGKQLYPEMDYWKPRSRAECVDMERPCPFVSCKYHLYIDVHPVRGSIKVNFPDVEVWEMTETCALDIADRGGITLEEVGEIMNLTRERVRQVETAGLAKLQALDDVARLKDYVY
ncbi:MAG: DNA-binding protein [Sandaracinaceae bacterium]|nr:DNA-binding protein [Sandaracinaceae bacterium]